MRIIKRYKKRILFGIVALGLFIAAFAVVSTIAPNKSEALVLCTPPVCPCTLCWCESCLNDPDCSLCEDAIIESMDTLVEQITELLLVFEAWLASVWNDILMPYIPIITEQLSATSISTTIFIGSFFDAKQQLETQTTLDKFHINAIRDYQPSVALCRFGTIRRGLASTQRQIKLNQQVMSDMSLARHLGREGAAALSPQQDIFSRIEQFKTTYCNPDDNKGFIAGTPDSLCGTTGGTDPARYNKDIHVTKTLFHPKTLDINFVDNFSTPSADEEDIFALSRNLFANKIFERPSVLDNFFVDPTSDLADRDDVAVQNRRNYHRFRSLIAKKNVIENSYFAIAAQKVEGTGVSSDYLIELLQQVGFEPGQASELIGEAPSYSAQMEILTKKLVQDPNFITSLTDKPANAARQQAALMSFELMQERDAYDSMRRQEVLLALVLEKLLKNRFDTLNSRLAVPR